jgi:hypothetical protein
LRCIENGKKRMNNGNLENPQERESFEGQVEVGNEQGQSPHIYIYIMYIYIYIPSGGLVMQTK